MDDNNTYNKNMQQRDENTEKLAKVVGKVISIVRKNNVGASLRTLAYEYDLDHGNLYRIENGKIEVKFVTLWKIAEALQMKCSELVSLIENEIGNDFHLYDD